MWTPLISCLIHSFFGYKAETGFSKLQSPSRFCIVILNGAQNLKFSGFCYATLIGWILYTVFWYKYKIKLVSRLRKREDQALISISTILKFPALVDYRFIYLSIYLSKYKFAQLYSSIFLSVSNYIYLSIYLLYQQLSLLSSLCA